MNLSARMLHEYVHTFTQPCLLSKMSQNCCGLAVEKNKKNNRVTTNHKPTSRQGSVKNVVTTVYGTSDMFSV